MSQHNLYAPPKGALDSRDPALVAGGGGGAGGRADGCWREGDDVVLAKDSGDLPDRCVRCNAPAEGYRLKRRLFWHPSGYYALIFIGILIYAIVALIVRKTAIIHVGLCEKHRSRRRTGIIIGLLGPVLMIATPFIVPRRTVGMSLAVAAMVGFGMIIAGIIMAQVVRPTFIDHDVVRLKTGRPFLDSITHWSADEGYIKVEAVRARLEGDPAEAMKKYEAQLERELERERRS